VIDHWWRAASLGRAIAGQTTPSYTGSTLVIGIRGDHRSSESSAFHWSARNLGTYTAVGPRPRHATRRGRSHEPTSTPIASSSRPAQCPDAANPGGCIRSRPAALSRPQCGIALGAATAPFLQAHARLSCRRRALSNLRRQAPGCDDAAKHGPHGRHLPLGIAIAHRHSLTFPKWKSTSPKVMSIMVSRLK
jgi:hypothetical protein